MIRLAHISDVHLGARLRAVPDHAEIDPIEGPYDAFAALLDAVHTGGYHGVLLAGDLFDRHEFTSRAVAAAQQALDDLHDAGLRVALIWGNHDSESAVLQQLRLPPSCWAAPSGTAATGHWPDLGIALHGQSIGDPNESRDLATGYPDPIPGRTNIGLLHTSLTGEHSRRPCAPTTVETLEARRYDYWALGHVHQRRLLTPAIAYPGSPHPARKAEAGPHGFLSVEITDTVTAHPVDTSPFVRETLSAGTESGIRKLFADYPPGDRVVLWTLTGPAELLATARAVAQEFSGFVVQAR